MSLIYGELTIDYKNRITIPNSLNLESDRLDLIMFNDYLAIFLPFESDSYIEKIANDTSFSLKERRDKLRVFSKNCVSVDVSNDSSRRINLTFKVMEKYNFDKKLILNFETFSFNLIFNFSMSSISSPITLIIFSISFSYTPRLLRFWRI